MWSYYNGKEIKELIEKLEESDNEDVKNLLKLIKLHLDDHWHSAAEASEW